MPTSPTLNNAEAQHQVYISRLAGAYGNEIDPILEGLGKWIRKRINQEGNRITTRKKFDKLIRDIEKRTGKDLSKYTASLYGNLDDLAEYEPQFQASLLDSVVVDYESEVPSATQVTAAATRNPMTLNGKGVSMTAYIDSFVPRNTEQILSYVRSGFAQGQTTQEITSNILNNQLVATRRDAKQIARTTTNHMATEARETTFQENSDLIIGYQIVATLDSRTSDICLFQDGNIYYYRNEYNPMPPFHPNACVAGTMITTERGVKKIEDIKVGDKVLTHTGRYMPVTTVMAREHQGNAYKLIDNFGRSVSLTDEHPVLTLVDGWKTAGDINVGDVLFNNSKEFIEIDGFRASTVKNAVLLNSHNIKTSVTDELVSYGIFSFSAGMSSSVNLDNRVFDDKVSDINVTDYTLKVEYNTDRIKGVFDDSFVHCKLILECGTLTCGRLDLDIPIVNGIVSLHSIARFFGALFCEGWINPCPMRVTSRLWGEFLTGINGILFASGFNSKLDASLSDGVVREAILSLDKPQAFSILPVLDFNEVPDGFVANTHFRSPNDLWFNSTIESIVEYTINDYVYNISVAEDETYIADGFLVHNCRSTTSPVLSDKFDFLDKGATRASKGAEGGQQVSTKQTTYSWLKTQPAWFQDETLGVAKGKIFRNAGLTTNEFKVAVSDGLGNPLTLEQIAQKDKKVREYMLNNPDLARYAS